MFGSNGYNLSDIAAVTREGDGMWGGNNGWWIILLFLFAFGGGWGGFNGRNGDIATQQDVRAAVDQQTLISKLDQQTYGLADSVYALNNTIVNGFHGVDNAVCTLGYQNQGLINNLSHQMSDCCCETQRAIERGFCDTNYNLATQSCDTRRTVTDAARDIIDNQNSNTRSILDFLTQDKIASLTSENTALKNAADNAMQTQTIINQLRPNPAPAYVVPNPYCNCGNGYGYNYNNCSC